ncbi:MAG: aminoglycoside phosphotransferase family protein [bacterium]|nr:aminoglycoside phosphotransferase family protein [bacterium]
MPRITWDDLPGHVRTRVEDVLGSPVIRHTSSPHGFSPGTADHVVCASGREAFVKAVHPDLNAHSPELHRQELRVMRALPPGLPVPRLLGGFDDDAGWVVLILEFVPGHHPSLPWTAETFSPVLDATLALSAGLTPSPIPSLDAASARMRPMFQGYVRCKSAPPDDLDPWTLEHLEPFHQRAQRGLAAVDGETLTHLDLRADNILLREADGSPVFIDWPWAVRGAPWLDATLLTATFAARPAADHEETDAVIRRIAAHAGVATEPLVDVLVGFCAFGVWESRQPDKPGLPTLRAFQRTWADALTQWLQNTSLATW